MQSDQFWLTFLFVSGLLCVGDRRLAIAQRFAESLASTGYAGLRFLLEWVRPLCRFKPAFIGSFKNQNYPKGETINMIEPGAAVKWFKNEKADHFVREEKLIIIKLKNLNGALSERNEWRIRIRNDKRCRALFNDERTFWKLLYCLRPPPDAGRESQRGFRVFWMHLVICERIKDKKSVLFFSKTLIAQSAFVHPNDHSMCVWLVLSIG